MRNVVPMLLVVACALPAAGVNAREMFRCNGSIVSTGLTMAEVLERCGEPTAREVSSVPVRARSRYGASYVVGVAGVEHWLYRRKSGQFPAFLTFDQGRLRNIELIYRR